MCIFYSEVVFLMFGGDVKWRWEGKCEVVSSSGIEEKKRIIE